MSLLNEDFSSQGAVGSIHPTMHRIVGDNIGKYLKKENNLELFFQKIKDHKKEAFIITNSPYQFVDVSITCFRSLHRATVDLGILTH